MCIFNQKSLVDFSLRQAQYVFACATYAIREYSRTLAIFKDFPGLVFNFFEFKDFEGLYQTCFQISPEVPFNIWNKNRLLKCLRLVFL